MRSAVVADRQAGASWAQIGAGLGITAEAARYGRLRFHYNDELSFGMRRSEPSTSANYARRSEAAAPPWFSTAAARGRALAALGERNWKPSWPN